MRTETYSMASAHDWVPTGRKNMEYNPNQSRLKRCGTDALTRVHEPQKLWWRNRYTLEQELQIVRLRNP